MSKNDTKIKELQKIVETKKKNLGSRPSAQFKTNGLIRSLNSLDSGFLNINTLGERALVELLKDIHREAYFWNTANNTLGTNQPYTYWNLPVEDIEHDFKIRIGIISYDKRKKELDDAEKALKSMLSEEARTEEALNSLSELLK